jgi:hypothetical protein
MDARLADVGYRLSSSNTGSCNRPQVLSGAVLHNLSQYNPKVRNAVSAAYGMTDGIGIMAVVANSAAERAGLQRSDEITAINGQSVVAATEGGASFDRMARATELLEGELRKGAVKLDLRRAGATLSTQLEADIGCGGRPYLSPSRQLNAWSDGDYVVVTTKIMNYVRNDDELAFVVAHEMAHNILENDARTLGAPSYFQTLVEKHASGSRAAELAADAYAVQLLTNAGYDPMRAIPFLKRARSRLWWAFSLSHPGFGSRIRTVMAAAAQVNAPETLAVKPETESTSAS